MIYLCCILLSFAFGLDIEVDYAIENGKRFSIITLKNDKAFPCENSIDINGNSTLITCVLKNKIPNSRFSTSKLEFFTIDSSVKNNSFYLLITPNKKQSLFANAFDLREDIEIPKERPKESKIWQIIGYDGEIPFLSNKKSYGLNFPINIPNTNTPYISELNIDASPLIYDEGADLGIFLNTKSLYEGNKFDESIKVADELLNNYPNSIFTRDTLLYKIRALSKNQNITEDMIEFGKKWIKSNATDVNVPEVLYIIGDSYSKLRMYNEARYYFNRILDEYANSKYAQYAQVGLAKNLAKSGDRNQPLLLYTKAYNEAKDLDSASYVAISWGEWELANKNTNNAINLFDRVIKNNPKYFIKNPMESYDSLKLWADNKLYDSAARAGDSMIDGIESPALKESLMLDVAKWYELANKPKDAHRINNAFLENFPSSKESPQVKIRNDNLLFALDESDLTKQIAQYDYIIKTYPNTPNAKLAYEKKAQNLFNLGQYADVLKLKNNLESNNVNITNSYINLIESSKECNSMINLYLESNAILITKNANELFQCLFDKSLFDKAKDLSTAVLGQSLANNNDRFLWLYNEAMANFALNNYANAIPPSRDALSLARDNASKLKAGSILFLSLANVNRRDEAIKVFNELSKIAPNAKEMLKIYNQMLLWAINDSDNIAIESYAKTMINIQNATKSYEYSPFIELSYADVLFADNRFSQMLEVLNGLKNANAQENQKANYMRGSAYYELGDNNRAKDEFNQCVKVDATYKQLCSNALELIK